ncbi:MAG: type VI-B CRISPR-associated RNA-guided ribonuclease Cas13b [Bernardetiaceae bacterium]|nr:type VI-B CRISPR-associated RNA-guided ribonuclease Cas13b [Bernardetiaceae bacterium]
MAYSITNPKDKPFFGTFLNLAQHNAYLIVSEIKDALGIRDSGQDGILQEDALDSSETLKILIEGSPEDKVRAMNIVRKHLPFVRAFISHDSNDGVDDYANIYNLLKSSLKALKKERNFYSHSKNQAKEYDLISIGEKDKNGEAIKSLETIRNNFFDFMGVKGSEQRKRATRRYPALEDVDMNPFRNQLKSLHEEKSPQLTESGLVFLMCLFLDRQQAEYFINSTTLYENSKYKYKDKDLDLDKICWKHYCAKLPQPRLESSDVLLDMLNELNRCPKPLYTLLSEENQKYFQAAINYDEGSVIQEDDEGNIETVQILKRHQDRFPYFTLRYFEEQEVFPQLRFQLYVGKLVSDYYLKKMQGEKEDRYILKDIHTFAHLKDIKQEDLEKEHGWSFFKVNHEEENNQKSKAEAKQIVQFSPHYNFLGAERNRIAFKLMPKKTMPTITDRSKQQNGKEKNTYHIENEIPDAIISVEELPNLFLCSYLTADAGNSKKLLDIDQNTMRNISKELKSEVANEDMRSFMTVLFKAEETPIKTEEGLKYAEELIRKKVPVSEVIDKVEVFESFNKVEYFLYKYIQTFRMFFNDLKSGAFEPTAERNLKKWKITKKNRKGSYKTNAYLPYDNERIEEIEERKKQLDEELAKRYEGLLTHKHLPRAVLDYLLGFYPLKYKEEVLNNLKEMRQDTEKRKNKLKALNEALKEAKKQGEDTFTLKQGNVADWLSKDIVYMKPLLYPKDRQNPKQGKPNNDQYNRLQKMLALYGGHKNELPQFLKELDLIGSSKNKHPFLEKVISMNKIPATLFKFYEEYLKARSNFLGYHNAEGMRKGIYEEIEGRYNRATREFSGGLKDEAIFTKYGYLFSFGLPPKDALKKNYTNVPILLPKGLFNPMIIRAFKDKGIEIGERANTTFALSQFVKNNAQPFYRWDRHYTFREEDEVQGKADYEKKSLKEQGRVALVKKLKTQIDALAPELDDLKNKKHKKKVFEDKRERFFILKKFRKRLIERDKLLRYELHKDRCLWLMAKDLISVRTKQGADITIDNFSLESIDTLLDQHVEMSVKIGDYYVKQEFERDKDNNVIYSTGEAANEEEKKKEEEMLLPVPKVKGEDKYVALNLKQYGDLRRFAKDKRLPALFAFFEKGTSFSKTQLDRALQALIKRGHEVMEKAFEVEIAIHNKWEDEFLDFAYRKSLKIKTEVDYQKHKSTSDFVNEFAEWVNKEHISHFTYITFLKEQKSTGIEGSILTDILAYRNHIAAHNSLPIKERLDELQIKTDTELLNSPNYLKVYLIDSIFKIVFKRYDKVLKLIDIAPA